MLFKFMTILSSLAIFWATPIDGQCQRCSVNAQRGSVHYESSQPQYESVVSRHEPSRPVYFYPDQQIYSHSPPSQTHQVRYSSGSSYSEPISYYESQPVVTYNRRVISSEPYYHQTYSQPQTRYYTAAHTPPDVVYRQSSYNTQGYSPSYSGCTGGGAGRTGRC